MAGRDGVPEVDGGWTVRVEMGVQSPAVGSGLGTSSSELRVWRCWLPGCPGWLVEWEDRVMSVGGMEREEWFQRENGREEWCQWRTGTKEWCQWRNGTEEWCQWRNGKEAVSVAALKEKV